MVEDLEQVELETRAYAELEAGEGLAARRRRAIEEQKVRRRAEGEVEGRGWCRSGDVRWMGKEGERGLGRFVRDVFLLNLYIFLAKFLKFLSKFKYLSKKFIYWLNFTTS